MTDYWVSRERHFCKYCNVWMQGDKLSVKHHEQGRKHKDRVEETFKQQRKAKHEAAQSERELQDQLRQIDEAARAKYAQDVASGSGVAPPPPPPRGGRPPPPPRREGGGKASGGGGDRGGGGNYSKRQVEDTPVEQEEEQEEDEDDLGVYEVRGVVYLEGKKHEDQLETGSACQIWVEDADEWLDALVEAAQVINVPNTDLTFRKFTVTYMLPGASAPVTETDLRSDRLRVPMPAGMTREAVEKMVCDLRGQQAPEKPVVIDETTGMGEWSTIEVRHIDESEEAIAQREAEAKAEEERAAEEQKRKDALEDFDAQGDNALGAFNPWGGSYKGVELDKPTVTTAQEEEDQAAFAARGSVDFKKRGGPKSSDGGKKQKRRRVKSDD